ILDDRPLWAAAPGDAALPPLGKRAGFGGIEVLDLRMRRERGCRCEGCDTDGFHAGSFSARVHRPSSLRALPPAICARSAALRPNPTSIASSRAARPVSTTTGQSVPVTT